VHKTGSGAYNRDIYMSGLLSTPKIAPLPPQPKEETIAEAGRRERKALKRSQVQTILTGGQGAAPNQQQKRNLLGGS